MLSRKDKDPLSSFETAMPHVSRFGVVFFSFMGIFCLASTAILLFLNASTILVLMPLALSLSFFYLALYLYQKGRVNVQHNYAVHIRRDNYGNIQQGGAGNIQNITDSNMPQVNVDERN